MKAMFVLTAALLGILAGVALFQLVRLVMKRFELG